MPHSASPLAQTASRHSGRAHGPEGAARGAALPGGAQAAEFSRPLRVSALDPKGERAEASADAQERAALARRFGVKAVGRMSFSAEIRPEGGGWRVAGLARARVTQPCVVTLEDVAQEIEEPFSRLYLPDAPEAGLADIDPDEVEDPPEPLGRRLDPAEMASEAVALAIDPYPRAAGARFETAGGAEPAAEAVAPRPFAALAALRARMGDDGSGGDTGGGDASGGQTSGGESE